MDEAIGKYDVLGTLGRGAHSTIQLIRRDADKKLYALKVVESANASENKFLEQARHEYRVAQRLNHANLIKIYKLETTKDWLFRVRKIHLLIEHCNGKPVDEFKRLPVSRLIPIFRRVAAGVAHMHRAEVLHADLKPNNILLGPSDDVKIIDYGLARFRGEDKARLQGTPEYLAPETANRNIISEKSDIYNFGATMYRLVTWLFPPRSITDAGTFRMDAKTFQKMIKPVADVNPDAPPELCEIIQRCLSFHPQKRPDKVSEIQTILERLEEKIEGRP